MGCLPTVGVHISTARFENIISHFTNHQRGRSARRGHHLCDNLLMSIWDELCILNAFDNSAGKVTIWTFWGGTITISSHVAGITNLKMAERNQNHKPMMMMRLLGLEIKATSFPKVNPNFISIHPNGPRLSVRNRSTGRFFGVPTRRKFRRSFSRTHAQHPLPGRFSFNLISSLWENRSRPRPGMRSGR